MKYFLSGAILVLALSVFGCEDKAESVQDASTPATDASVDADAQVTDAGTDADAATPVEE